MLGSRTSSPTERFRLVEGARSDRAVEVASLLVAMSSVGAVMVDADREVEGTSLLVAMSSIGEVLAEAVEGNDCGVEKLLLDVFDLVAVILLAGAGFFFGGCIAEWPHHFLLHFLHW